MRQFGTNRITRPYHALSLLGLLMSILWLTACQNAEQGGGAPLVMPPRPTPIVLATPEPVDGPAVLPTRPPTDVLPPTPTRDPDLADWTILVYAAADGERDAFVADDLNEMEAAGSSERVNLIVQVDSLGEEGVVRYRIQPDENLDEVTSEVVEQLPESSSGDPAVLADFLRWGLATYPANRTALVIAGAGGGWRGVATDWHTAVDAPVDVLSLNDLEAGLAAGVADAAAGRLDLLLFDAPLMGQMDVLQAVQPYAAYAVAAPGLMPGSGIDWRVSLAQWLADPAVEADRLAAQLVNDYGNVQQQLAGETQASLTAVDLTRFKDVAYALDVLLELTAVAENSTLAMADARLQAQPLATGAPGSGSISAVDLGHFAGLLLRRAPDEPVRLAAAQLADALASATIAHTAGTGLPYSQGIAIYFPDQRTAVADEYADAARVAGWADFLVSYRGTASSRPFEAALLGDDSAAAGPQQPVPAAFELAGLGVADAFWVGTQADENGQRRVLVLDDIPPEFGDGAAWPDGVARGETVWDTQGAFLASGDSGGFVAARPLPGSAARVSVAGRLPQAATGDLLAAQLWLDEAAGRSERAWLAPLPGFVVETRPEPGDLFELQDIFLEEDGRFRVAQGGPLAFDAAGGLQISPAPLPDGDYAFGLVARNEAGEPAVALRDLAVGPEQRREGVQTYFDAEAGFQFDLPDSWQTPVYSGTLLVSRNISDTTRLTIAQMVDPALADAEAVAAQALETFGEVAVVYAEDTAVGGSDARLTAYGYTTPDDEARTGVLVALLQDGVGYTVDVDGPAMEEEATLSVANGIIASWQFRADAFGRDEAAWQQAELLGFVVAHPVTFVYEPAETWERFVADSDTFVALRVQPAAASTASAVAGLIADAGRGVEGFESGPIEPLTLGGAVWQVSEMAYVNGRGEPIQGVLMARDSNGSQLLLWAEAPAESYETLRERVFFVMAADALLAEG